MAPSTVLVLSRVGDALTSWVVGGDSTVSSTPTREPWESSCFLQYLTIQPFLYVSFFPNLQCWIPIHSSLRQPSYGLRAQLTTAYRAKTQRIYDTIYTYGEKRRWWLRMVGVPHILRSGSSKSKFMVSARHIADNMYSVHTFSDF